MPIVLAITNAGEAAVQAASGADPVVIAEIGLSNTPFALAPTLTALPGEFKRIGAVAGVAAAPNLTHMSAYDNSADVWDATGFGLFLDDGTLFAAYSSPTTVLSKASLAFALLSLDVAWEADLAALISFGAPVFTSPPATEEMRGIVELLTQAEANAGTDNDRALTALRGKAALPSWLQAATVLAKLLTVDGAGSELDADKLDGLHANELIPPGVIWMWSGTIATIPAGFALCDGTNGTPDLTARFILGAGDGVDPGDAGGTFTHNHGGATDGHSLTEAQLPAHTHAQFANATSAANITGGGNAAWSSGGAVGNQDYDIKGTATGPTLGASSSVGGGDPHDHPIDAADHLPPYFALAFIMKL